MHPLRPLRFLAALALLCATSARAADVYWTNLAGGNWSNPANWSSGFVPGSSDNVYITSNGTYIVILDAGTTVARLTLGGDTGTQVLTNGGNGLRATFSGLVTPNGVLNVGGGNLSGTNLVMGKMTWSGGPVFGSLTIGSGGMLDIGGNSPKTLTSVALTNAGTIVWTGSGDIDGFGGSSSIVNLSGGLFDLQGDRNMVLSSGTLAIHNAGLIRKSAGAGTNTIFVSVNNTGTIETLAGTVILAGGGNIDGTYSAAAGTAINFSGGTFTPAPGFVFSGAGFVGTAVGSLTMTGTLRQPFNLTGGSSGGSLFGNSLVIASTLNWSGGRIGGTVTIATNGMLSLSGGGGKYIDSVTLTNHGLIHWAGEADIVFNNGRIENEAEGVFEIQNDRNISLSTGNLILNNAGLIRKSASTGTNRLFALVNNTGTIEVQTGALGLARGGTIDGLYSAASGTAVDFSGGTFALTPSFLFNGTGFIGIASGSATLTGTLRQPFNLTGGSSGGSLSGNNLIIASTLNWSGGRIGGTVTIATNGMLSLSGGGGKYIDSVTLTNHGLIHWAGEADIVFNNGRIENEAEGVFEIQNDRNISLSTGNLIINNAGLIRKSAGTGTNNLHAAINNTGVVEAQTGVISFSRGGVLDGPFTAEAGARIAFNGGTFILNGPPAFGGAGTITFGPSAAIQFAVPITSFTHSGGTLNGTNTVAGTLNWIGGSIFQNLTVTPSGTLNITGSATKSLGVSFVTNSGLIVLSGTGKTSFSSGRVWNQTSGLIDLQSDAQIENGGSGFVVNEGLFRKSGGTGTNLIGVPFTNVGAVEAQTGVISFNGGGTLDGSFTAAAGARIEFNSGTFILNGPPAFGGAGTITFGPSAAIQFAVPITSFTHSGGTLNGTNTVAGTLNWSGGSIFGTLIIATNGVLNVYAPQDGTLSGVVRNDGTISLSGSLNFNGAGQIQNRPGGLLDIQADLAITSSTAGAAITNDGVFRKRGETGIASCAVFLHNRGLVEAQSGVMRFDAGGVLDGIFAAAAGARIEFSAGTFTLNGPPQFSGAGVVAFGPSASIRFSVPITSFTHSIGTLSGTNTVTGTLNWTGGTIGGPTTVASGGTFEVSGAGAKTLSIPLTNAGRVVLTSSSSLTLGSGSRFENLAGGVVDFQNNQPLSVSGGGLFINNSGVLRKSAGAGTNAIQVPVNNSGTIEPLVGAFAFNAGLTSSPSSALSFVLGGTRPRLDYGQVNVTGNLEFGGTLRVSLTNDFVPAVGDLFSILNYPSHSGGFRQAQGLGLTGDPFLQVLSEERNLSLIAKTLVGHPPPPATNLFDQAVVIGGVAVFRIEPQGEGSFTYQWRFNDVDIADATNSVFGVTNAQPADAGTYSVVVTEVAGGFQLAGGPINPRIYSAVLSILAPPNITTHPVSQAVSPGANVTLSVTATGPGPLQYQWRLNGANIPNATNTTYSIVNAQPTNGGSYSVTVANRVSAVRSGIAVLVVTSPALPFADNFADRVTTNSLTGRGSGTNTLATKETGEPDHAGKPGGASLWYAWTAPTNGIATFSTRGSSFDTLLAVYAGTTLGNLAVIASDDDRAEFFASEAAFVASAGSNYLIAIDGYGGAAGNVVLSWNLDTNLTATPRILAQPISQAATAGETVLFSVVATSTQTLRYRWIFDEYLAIEDATNATLTLIDVQAASAGRYAVEVINQSGQLVRSRVANLEIGPPTKSLSTDKFRDLFKPGGAGGAPFTPASATTTFPIVSIGSLGSQNLNNFNSSTDQGEPLHGGVIGGSSRWFMLTASEQATMIIDTLGSDFDTVLAVYTGTNLFTVQQVASDNNGAPDGVRSRVRFRTVAGTSYSVAVDGVNGAQGNVVLNWRMGDPPVITSFPTNRTAWRGGAARFTVAATGRPPPVYQWRWNGVDRPGATNAELILPNAQLAQAGLYRVAVSNLIDTVLSAQATLVVKEFTIKRGSMVFENGQFRLSIEDGAGERVIIEATENVGDPLAWFAVFTNQPGAGPINFTDLSTGQRYLRFYRARIGE